MNVSNICKMRKKDIKIEYYGEPKGDFRSILIGANCITLPATLA